MTAMTVSSATMSVVLLPPPLTQMKALQENGDYVSYDVSLMDGFNVFYTVRDSFLLRCHAYRQRV